MIKIKLLCVILSFLFVSACSMAEEHVETSQADFVQMRYSEVLNGDFSNIANIDDYDLESLIWLYSPFHDKDDPDHWEYTLVDMDYDAIPELFIRINNSPAITAVFHCTDSEIVVWDWDSVEMTSYFEPLVDGRLLYTYKDYYAIATYDSAGNRTYEEVENPEIFDELLIRDWLDFWVPVVMEN